MSAVVPTPPLSAADLAAYAKKTDIVGPEFVSPTIMPWATLIASFPASEQYRGKYARVSNLFGFEDGVLRCGSDNAGRFYWKPTQTDYGRDLAVAGSMTITPLGHPTTFNLTGSIGLGITRELTLDPTNGWPGMIKEFRNGLTSLLGGLNILGTGLGTAIAIPLGGYKKFYLDFSSGTPVFRQLV